MKDRESQMIEAIATMAKVVSGLMDDVLKMAVEIKEIRKQLNDKTTA